MGHSPSPCCLPNGKKKNPQNQIQLKGFNTVPAQNSVWGKPPLHRAVMINTTTDLVPLDSERTRLAGDTGAGGQHQQQNLGIKRMGTTMWENIPF